MDDERDKTVLSYAQLKILKAQRDKIREERLAEQCKKRLSAIISKKIETTFIGAIASVESYLGFLWGINLRDAERTEEQKKFFELWKALRSEILTNGNTQLRAAQNEITQYNVHWNRYHTELKVIDKFEEDQTNGE